MSWRNFCILEGKSDNPLSPASTLLVKVQFPNTATERCLVYALGQVIY